MKSIETNTLEMLLAVRQFGLTHAEHFPADGGGAEELINVAKAIDDMEAQSTTQAQHAGAAREQTTQKRAAFESLRAMLEAITRTARTMSRKRPGIEDKFRLPSNKRVQDWLAAARAFLTEAEPLKNDFARLGMASTFLADLGSRIQAVQQAFDGRAKKSFARISATVAVAQAADRGRQAVRALDAIVRNLFADDPTVLAEWESASHVERAPRHAEKREPEPEPAKA